MKRFLLPLLAAFALPTAVSSETWILISSSKDQSNYIDASSVVKNGYRRYATIKYQGTYSTNEAGIKADCNEKQYFVSQVIAIGIPVKSHFKRKSKDYWVSVFSDGSEHKMNLEKNVKHHEGIYQFLCKKWK